MACIHGLHPQWTAELSAPGRSRYFLLLLLLLMVVVGVHGSSSLYSRERPRIGVPEVLGPPGHEFF